MAVNLLHDDFTLLDQLKAGPQIISGNKPRHGADRLVAAGYATSRSLNISTVEYEITQQGIIALLLRSYGVNDTRFSIEPHRNDVDGLWYLKLTSEGNPALLIGIGTATRLATELRNVGADHLANRLERELEKSGAYFKNSEEGDSERIYADASQLATLVDGPARTDCPTLQEAVIAWHRLPPERQSAATINSAGRVYGAAEIHRLYHGPKLKDAWATTRFFYSYDSSEALAAGRRNMAAINSGAVEPPPPLENAGVAIPSTPSAGTAPTNFQRTRPDDFENQPDPIAIPEQTLAASQFALDAQGQLDLLPDPPFTDNAQREIYQDVRYKTLSLSGLGHNQLAEMSEPVARFLSATPEHIEDLSITRLWSRGNTLRRRLKAHDIAAITGDPTDPALLSPSVAEHLRDLVDTYNVFIVGDPKGRELDQVRLGPEERNDADSIIHVAVTITDAVRVSEGLATDAAVEALAEQVEAARAAPPGVDGDQAVDLSRKTTGNFVVELLRSAYRRVLSEPGFAWREYRAGAYRALGAITTAGMVGWPIVSFITNNAQALRTFAEQAFHNPTLLEIIDVISKIGAAH